ncbi:hypothetical protein DVA76_18870, partial [Acinetobacter baumannii]
YDHVPLALFPYETEQGSFILPHSSPCLLLLYPPHKHHYKDKNKNETPLWQAVVWLIIIGLFCSTFMKATFW